MKVRCRIYPLSTTTVSWTSLRESDNRCRLSVWYLLACKLPESRDSCVALCCFSTSFKSIQYMWFCHVRYSEMCQLCTKEPSPLADVWWCPFCFCLNGVLPALVTEGTGGRGCWDVDPGTKGVGTDLAVSDAGEKVLWTDLLVNSPGYFV